jgi:hypothetical protein
VLTNTFPVLSLAIPLIVVCFPTVVSFADIVELVGIFVIFNGVGSVASLMLNSSSLILIE